MTDYTHEDGQRPKVIRLRPVPDEQPAPESPRPPPPPPDGALPWESREPRRPLLPGWVLERNGRLAAIRWLAGHLGHHAAFHGIRLPHYSLKIALRAPLGVCLALKNGTEWMFDRHEAGSHHLLVDASARRAHKEYATASRIRKDRVRTRMAGVVAGLIVTVVLLAVADLAWPPSRWFVLLLAVAGFGWYGRPRNKPFAPSAVSTETARRPTPDLIIEALSRLGLPEVNRAVREQRPIPVLIGRDGPGWRADIDLPPGVTATMIMDKREQFASGLRRATGCVWPEPALDQHAGKLVVYIADTPMSLARQQAWPLTRQGKGDVFRPLPFGTDQRGRIVTITLIFESVLIGAIPRSGKTGAMRVIGLGAALDPSCELHAFDLKGTGDLAALGKVGHRYGSGADEETLARCMDSLREVHGYLIPRSKTIAGLPADICPDRKVTPELAARRSLGLYPVGILIDEIQELFESDYKAEATSLCLALLKRGPAMGIFLVMATQRPDSQSLPKAISANAGVRFCLRIVDEPSNNMILGAGMYGAGYRATMFTVKDKGVGWLAGQAEDPQVTRTFYMDAPAADKIALRALSLRRAAGTLSGEASGLDAAENVSLLRDVLDVMTEPELWLEPLAERLGSLRPQLYDGWDARQLGSALRTRGVTPRQQWRDEANRNGTSRSDVIAAMGRTEGA